MNIEQIMKQAMDKRAEAGLKLSWIVEDGSVFTAYPKNNEQKANWLASAERKGWKLL